MNMRWHTLLFMHWPVPAEALRPFIPAQLPIDIFDGSAWIGVVPFTMSHVYPTLAPVSVPKLSAFAELNVRTYVTLDGKPGVWFVSLDCENKIAVRLARQFFHLPYMDAVMKCEQLPLPLGEGWGEGGGITYSSQRIHKGEPPAELVMRYRPAGPVMNAMPGSLEYFLTARYCLYSADKQQNIYRCEIDHGPWPLQPAACEVERNTMTEQIHLTLPAMQPHLLYAHQVDMVAWTLQKC
jgi:uncharacterized protein YqjF (DUF2071 family)